MTLHLRNGLFLDAVRQFDAGDYFVCHESLEILWKDSDDELLRDFYQGILQVAVGFYHWRHNNRHGAHVKLKQGLGRLAGLVRQPDTLTHPALAELLGHVALAPFIRQCRACLVLIREDDTSLPPFPAMMIPRLGA